MGSAYVKSADSIPRHGSRLLGLDGLRALAILLVFVDHATNFGRTIHLGAGGVWLFFVLSGFLIIGILNDEAGLIAQGRQTYLRAIYEFYVRRSFRIFPPYYLVVISLTAVFVLFGISGIHWFDIGMVALYGTNIYSQPTAPQWYWYFAHFWSLAVEEQFYIFAAPLFLFLRGRATIVACLVLIALSVSTTIKMHFANSNYMDTNESSLINFGMFAVGGLAALTPVRQGQPGNREWLPMASLILFVVAPIAIAAFKPLEIAKPQIMCLMACALIVFVAGNQNSFLVRMLELKPMRELGKISYTFYLVHTYFIMHGDELGIQRVFGFAVPFHIMAPFAQILEFGFAVMVARLSWVYVEKPLLRVRDKILRPWPEERPAYRGVPLVGE